MVAAAVRSSQAGDGHPYSGRKGSKAATCSADATRRFVPSRVVVTMTRVRAGALTLIGGREMQAV